MHEHAATLTSKRREQLTFIDDLAMLPLREQPLVPRRYIGKERPGDRSKLLFDGAHQPLRVLEAWLKLLYRRQICVVERLERA